MQKFTTKQLTITALVVIIVAGVIIPFLPASSKVPLSVADEQKLPAPPDDDVRAQLAASKGFQYFISYTDNGFQPARLTAKSGETVRFSNNSSQDIWIAEVSAGKLRADSSCDPKSFSTCKALKPGAFWEYTFKAGGIIEYHDVFHTNDTGTINVK